MRGGEHGTERHAGGAPFLDEGTLRDAEPYLRRIALWVVRNDALARDLIQETYLAAWQGQGTYDGRSDVRAWMAGILRRKIADHFRRARREVVTDRPPEPRAGAAALADDQADGREKQRMVEAHLGELPELERSAVVLCDVQQRDRARAAQVLGVTRGHLRVLLHRGRHRLRRSLLEDGLLEA